MKRIARQDGFVLIIVMIVVMLVSLAGLSFVLTLSTENKAAHLHGDEVALRQAVASGEEWIKAASSQPWEARQSLGGLFDNPDRFQGLALDDRPPGDRIRFSIVSPQVDDDQVTGARFGLQDESARLNLASLIQWERQSPEAGREALLELPGMTEAMADAVLDWIDPDDQERPAGAESPYYVGRGLPYSPRNGVPASLEELLLVRDISRDALFGSDADFNYQVEEREARVASAAPLARTAGLPWALLLTVYSAERNAACDGTPRIYLNERDLHKLHRQLEEVFDPSWARFIIAYRQFGPYDPTQPSGAHSDDPHRLHHPRTSNRDREFARTDTLTRLDLSQPPRFELASVLDLIGAQVLIPAEGRNRKARHRRRAASGRHSDEERDQDDVILESPLRDDPNQMSDYLPELVDRTTVVADSVIRGRVNINRAPRAVLRAVPGLEPAVADRILTARTTAIASDLRAYRTAIWLLTEGVVDLETMKRLMPYVTGGGDVFRAQVVAWDERSGLSARAEVVIDATVQPPRQIYWKEMSLLGRGFSPTAVNTSFPGSAWERTALAALPAESAAEPCGRSVTRQSLVTRFLECSFQPQDVYRRGAFRPLL